MKKFTFLLLLCIMYPRVNHAQFLTATYCQLPTGSAFILNSCDSSTKNVITFEGWAGEYSLIEVNAGETYEFNSSIATDFITIGDDAGSSAYASGVTPVTWTSGFTRDIRFYTHTDAACGEQQFGRERSVICGSGFLSNKDVTFQGLQYYPNPVDSILNLTSKENIDQVLIYNMIGQEVLKVSPNS